MQEANRYVRRRFVPLAYGRDEALT